MAGRDRASLLLSLGTLALGMSEPEGLHPTQWYMHLCNTCASSSHIPSHTHIFLSPPQIWGTRDFRLLKTLEGHEGRVVDVDWAPDGRRLVTASHDRTFKVWADSKEF
jgi:WD40 repeat protein